MTYDPSKFLFRSRQKTRDIHKRYQWDIERVAEANESSRLVTGIDIKASGQGQRVVCD
eukprot:CAMPEP_0197192156 /NCGR_PEP_ID=MMETSP1423-20130617/24642_1 /TAXON_ID=476441 /ORGANISM="Pseudo-nitzschia heimii, Strain UNC1101" /LENGTH=57 /DNA_ID=CAMNT_0042644991 /DNA_START=295 /DNA_END=465 /DNA_ORIENTATION=-